MSAAPYKILFAAGGTGGHLYPAIAVAEQIKNISPETKILFVGTKKKIEAKVLPALGYQFKTIWISGVTRKLAIKNLLFPIKLIVSMFQSLLINLKFKPNVAVGAGAYVSGPVAIIAHWLGSKIVLLEQNSYPGVTNRMLEGKAHSVHISFQDSAKYFKNESKLILSGNPVRPTMKLGNKEESILNFSLDKKRKTLLVIGGSLGAKSLNQAVAANIKNITENNIQIIWQTGELYFDHYKNLMSNMVKVMPFISDMSEAYSACDLLLARAGATTIAEVAYLGLPTVFVPSQNVAANHQYKNAKSIVDQNAGLLIEDSNILEELSNTVIPVITDSKKLQTLSENIKKISKPNAAAEIAENILKIAAEF